MNKPIEQLKNRICAARFRELMIRAMDGELDAQAQSKLDAHLKSCARCRASFARQQFAMQLISQYTLPDASPAGKPEWVKVSAFAKPQPELSRGWIASRFLNRRGVVVTMAIVVLILAIFAWRYFQSPPVTWEIVRLTGNPKINQRILTRTDKIAMGETVETDSQSRAMIQVGIIGQVEIDANTRLRLISAGAKNHRLALERGKIYATILAPPQEFFVETPSALAVDMGCAYSLEVNDAGESTLFVKSGWVALKLGGRESLVPAGSMCQTKPGIGPGTPYFEDATKRFKIALERLDFQNGGKEELTIVLNEARVKDTLTLWHLLERASGEARLPIYERLARLAPPPDEVTREGAVAGNRDMLNRWRERIEYLSIGIDLTNAPTATGTLKPVGAMIDARFNHSATLLNDGRVLIAGGREKQGTILSSAEIYDPATGEFTATGAMKTPRVGQTATLLPDGKVLIAGGSDSEFFYGALSSAELYDPTTGQFSTTGDMHAKRLAHKATLLQNGKVLITGGQGEDLPNHDTTEIYDPMTGVFTLAAKMHEKRADHTATLLADGRVLVTGGSDARHATIQVSDTAEIYDPVNNQFTAAGKMSVVRFKHSAELLPDGRVIIIGGSNVTLYEGRYASAEIFDPQTRQFTPTGKLNTARYKIRDAVVLLSNGKILVAGGGRAEVYDPATGLFAAVKGGMGTTRFYATATLLQNGEVLIVGGYSAESNNMSANASAWIYQPE
ncbi:MAG: kelch repeat-containing protein [Acidobacteriota bacterium]